ncbi:hypothetical protein ACHQM5_029198 [Ranunculus cassubicifolius]
MSLETVATLAAPIIEKPVACVSDASARHLRHLTKFRDNFECLRDKANELVAHTEDVKRRIEVEETNQQMERTRMVVQWLQKAEASQKEVDLILQKCSGEIEQRCCANYRPKNWWARYKLGKKVCKELITITDLISQGKFDAVAGKSRPAQVEVQPASRTVGMDAKFEEVWSWLGDDQAKIIGIYGMGGVGKTTLLKKINNKFEGEVSSFDLVIWVVVSSKFSAQNVQKQIMKRLGLTWSEDDDQNYNARRVFDVLSKKKFLLLLDDVWEGLDLEIIGIPSPYTCNNNISKVVFTTRSEKVCGSMEANKKYKVLVLEWEQAWELFQQKVGEGTLSCDPEIPKLAKAVSEECGGLPLALITTGRAMSNKKTPREWKHALATLKQYASRFEGMDEKVFSILKFSYDNLEDDTARDCFLYCSLYPEDHDINIEEIIYFWIGEGFFDEFEEFDMARGRGYAVITTLKSACLLEMGSEEELHVKLHDVVRDLALWIARNKYLVQAGVGLSQAPKIEDWEGKERISLMRNGIRELIGAPNCPRLVTLMLQQQDIVLPHVVLLSVIPDDFFHYMPNLKVLDFSQARINYLPKSIGCLLELQYLNLRNTHIKTLPKELRNLEKLKYLNLWATLFLDSMPPGTISCFPRLQVLYLDNLDMDGLIEAELETLQQLGRLDLFIKKFLIHQNMLLSQRLQSCLEILKLHGCYELTELALMSSLHLGKTKRLRQLTIYECSNLEKLTINSSLEADKDDMGPLFTLEVLYLSGLPKLSNILWAETATQVHFKLLTTVHILGCNALKDISWLVLAPFLRYLYVYNCSELEEIILDRFAAVTIEDQNALSRLVEIVLISLPNLKSIVTTSFSFPSLQSIKVLGCPLLKKLPFASNNIHNSKLLEIRGNVKWWEELEWEDQTIKTSLQPIFITF